MKLLIQGSLAVSIANATTKITGLMLIPIFTFYLSPEDYGRVSMVMLVITILNLIYNPGMVSATMRLYHATDDERQRKILIGSAYRFFLYFPLSFVFIGFLFGPEIFSVLFSNFSFYPYGCFAVILAFLGQSRRIWVALMTLRHKVHVTALYSTISVILGLLTSLLLIVVFKMGAMGKVIGMVPTVLIFFFLSLFTIRKYTGGLWSYDSIKKQLKFGLPLVIAIWSYEFLHVADRYILENMLDISSVGLYSFGYKIAEVPMILVLGVKQLWNPIFYENMNKKDYIVLSKLTKYYITALTFFNLMVVLFGKEIIILIVNERYHGVIPIIGVIVLGTYFNGVLTIPNSFLSYSNKFLTVSMIGLIATILNILLNIALIPQIGIMGSAIATMISYFIYNLISIVNQRKEMSLILNKSIIIIPSVCMIFAVSLNMVLINIFPGSICLEEIGIKLIITFAVVGMFFLGKIISTEDVHFFFNSLRSMIIK